jgi:hypothetical protein
MAVPQAPAVTRATVEPVAPVSTDRTAPLRAPREPMVVAAAMVAAAATLETVAWVASPVDLVR